MGEGFPYAGGGFHGKGFAHTQGARCAARTHSHARRTARPPPDCPRVGVHSSDLCEGTEGSRGGATVGTGASGSVVNHAWMRSPHGEGRPGVTAVCGGSLCRGPVGRSVGGTESASGPVRGGRSWAYGQRGSR